MGEEENVPNVKRFQGDKGQGQQKALEHSLQWGLENYGEET